MYVHLYILDRKTIGQKFMTMCKLIGHVAFVSGVLYSTPPSFEKHSPSQNIHRCDHLHIIARYVSRHFTSVNE